MRRRPSVTESIKLLNGMLGIIARSPAAQLILPQLSGARFDADSALSPANTSSNLAFPAVHERNIFPKSHRSQSNRPDWPHNYCRIQQFSWAVSKCLLGSDPSQFFLCLFRFHS
jgi:hypothetical protein